MDGQTGMIILYIVIGFFGFVTICCGTIFLVLWRRRKLVYCHFLNDYGKWEKQTYMPEEIGKLFYYDDEVYKFDIELATHDKINRPVAHYYKGNPEQQIFNPKLTNKKVKIDTKEITQKDFKTLITTKVLKADNQTTSIIANACRDALLKRSV